MGRFDRYMLSQLMVLFGFFSLVLVLIYWINRAVSLFDQLIADGQSAAVFLEFTALSLPSVMRLALPLAAFASAVYVTNRMTTESELTVVQATGYSPFRLARPVMYFGLIVAVMMSALMHFLVPLSNARLVEREAEIAQNITARFLTEGRFLEPVNGVTFYIREITPDGELRDVFLSDIRDADEQMTYTAAQAFLVRQDGATQLVMIDGMIQILRTEDQRLFRTSFDDFAFNISDLMTEPQTGRRRENVVPTWELLAPTQALQDETNRSTAQLLATAHDRFSQSILGAVAALLGFSALMVGGYSRFGVWKQIIFAIVLIIIVKAVETSGMRTARSDPDFWFVAYLQCFVGFVMIWFLLVWASRPYLFKRRIPEGSTP
ncbi:LPS export ABC transporter permease LptF [Loktanella sp. 5RATIMAR09]|uniref:LPS export ABC transporter permease LptF n=1 Tax=Loktanella sp. 5RATIMAR09 TaxID=1225655 RepID=UPI000A564740